MKKIRIITMMVCLFVSISGTCKGIVSLPNTWKKSLAILDMVERNGDNEITGDYSRNVYSAEYMAEVAGTPYYITTDVSEATKANAILLTSRLKSKSFTDDEIATLHEYVAEGGTLIVPVIYDIKKAYTNLLGITAAVGTNANTRITWNKDVDDHIFDYIDQPEEETISIGSGTKAQASNLKVYEYTILEDDDTDILGTYENGQIAAVRHKVGSGCVYTFPTQWRQVIQRSQLNKDPESQRIYSNAYEPSSEIFPLMIRSIIVGAGNVTAWKHTVPEDYKTVLIPTHDCDSRTAYEQMHYMSDYEKEIGLSSQFFLTVHYFRDEGYLSAFYDATTMVEAKKLLVAGHTVGSHSICHYPDFSTTSLFPLTKYTKEEYAQVTRRGSGTVSTGGSTWAEVVLSKQIIENDLKNKVRSFRTGHLCMNKNIPVAEQEGGYNFASCYASGDLLSSFPFRERLDNDWAGEFNNVLVMPLSISDVFSNDKISEDNYLQKVEIWNTVLGKLQTNYAPTILLIHPNRDWKMFAERELVKKLNLQDVGLYNFQDYGDFWNGRRDFTFETAYDEANATIYIKTTMDQIKANPKLHLMLEAKEGVEFKQAMLVTENGLVGEMELYPQDNGRYSVNPADFIPTGIKQVNASSSTAATKTFDISGRRVATPTLPGIYLVKQGNETKKVIVR